MELTIKVDDKEEPFVIELLRKFSFVQEIRENEQSVSAARIDELWQHKAMNLFATKADFEVWLSSPNLAAKSRLIC